MPPLSADNHGKVTRPLHNNYRPRNNFRHIVWQDHPSRIGIFMMRRGLSCSEVSVRPCSLILGTPLPSGGMIRNFFRVTRVDQLFVPAINRTMELLESVADSWMGLMSGVYLKITLGYLYWRRRRHWRTMSLRCYNVLTWPCFEITRYSWMCWSSQIPVRLACLC